MRLHWICGALFSFGLGSAVAQETFDFKVIDDIQGYFDRKYRGQHFSANGSVSEIAKTGRLFASYWYIQVENGGKKVYCTIANNEADLRLDAVRKNFPTDTRVRISGTMVEWVPSDGTVRLEDFCRIQKLH